MEPQKRLGAGQRIRRQKTFKNLVEKGQFARGAYFYLWVVRQEGKQKTAAAQKPMIGIVVSRKTDPSAVGRNAWKRQVREIFREHQTSLHPGTICLVKVRHAMKRPAFSAAEEDLVKLFKKAGAWT